MQLPPPPSPPLRAVVVLRFSSSPTTMRTRLRSRKCKPLPTVSATPTATLQVRQGATTANAPATASTAATSATTHTTQEAVSSDFSDDRMCTIRAASFSSSRTSQRVATVTVTGMTPATVAAVAAAMTRPATPTAIATRPYLRPLKPTPFPSPSCKSIALWTPHCVQLRTPLPFLWPNRDTRPPSLRRLEHPLDFCHSTSIVTILGLFLLPLTPFIFRSIPPVLPCYSPFESPLSPCSLPWCSQHFFL